MQGGFSEQEALQLQLSISMCKRSVVQMWMYRKVAQSSHVLTDGQRNCSSVAYVEGLMQEDRWVTVSDCCMHKHLYWCSTHHPWYSRMSNYWWNGCPRDLNAAEWDPVSPTCSATGSKVTSSWQRNPKRFTIKITNCWVTWRTGTVKPTAMQNWDDWLLARRIINQESDGKLMLVSHLNWQG